MSGALKHILLSELVAALEAEGYSMGTGKYLQVQELLSRLPEDLPLEGLSSVLCPLFARSPQEQADFYRTFEQCLARAKEIQAYATTPGRGHAHAREARIWRNTLLVTTALFSFLGGCLLDVEVFSSWRNPTIPLIMGALLLAGYIVRRTVQAALKRRIWLAVQLLSIVAGVGIKQVFRPAPPPDLPPDFREYALRPGDTLVENVRILEGDSLLFSQLGSGASQGTDSVFGDYSVSERGRFTYIVRDTFNFFRDTILVESLFASARKDSTLFVIVLQPGLDEIQPVRDTSAVALAIKTPPYSRPVNLMLPPAERAYLIKLYQRYADWAKACILILAGLGVWSLLQWRERRRRFLRAVAPQERNKPPYIWKLPIETPEDIIPGESAPMLLNLLRRRIRGEVASLDISASIKATIRRLGMADFRYKTLTTPPEYLVLIDRQGLNDHRARLFDWLFRRFQAQEAPIARYFFDGDIRLCTGEQHPEGISLRELQHRYGNARLLILSHGHQLLSPMNGRLERWTALLGDWRRRALLSPVPLRAWSRKEHRLAEIFSIFPASPQGCSAAIEQLDAAEPLHAEEWIKRIDDVSFEPIVVEGDLLSALQRHFPEPVLDWIAACAVYPILQWELTLYLGSELSAPGHSLVHFDNLMSMTRLPWFVAGRIPDAARMELLDYLASRGLETKVRAALQRIFEQGAQPDPQSVSYEEFRVNAALNELALTTQPARKRELSDELAGFRAAGYALDAVAFRYVKDAPGYGDFDIPVAKKKMPEWLVRIAAPAGALKPSLLDSILAWPIFILVGLGLWTYNPPFDLCAGKRALYFEGLELCVGTPAEELFYHELSLKNLIQSGDTVRCDSILTRSRALFPACISEDTIAFLKNVAVYYYNKGVDVSINYEIRTSSRLDTANVWPWEMCYWFQKAYALEREGGGIVDAGILSAAGKCHMPASPDSGVDAPVPQDEFKPIVIRGRIVDASNAAPLGGVSVSSGAFKALSDRQGYYTMEFPAGADGTTLAFRLEKNGFLPAQLTVAIAPGRIPPVAELVRQRTEPERPAVFRKGDLLGLRDNKGNIILLPEYQRIEYEPTGNWFRVEQRLRGSSIWGYVDLQGKVVIPLKYRDIGPLRDGLVRAQNDAGWGFIDAGGATIIAFQYDQAGDFANGRAEVGKQSVLFTIDKSGRCVANCPVEQQVTQVARPARLSFSGEVLLYFDEDEPPNDLNSYEDLYAAYYARKQVIEKMQYAVQQNANASSTGQAIERFFESEVRFGKEQLEVRLLELSGILQAGLAPGEQALILVAGYTGSKEKDAERLARRRAASVEEWIKRYNKRFFQAYLTEGKLRILTEGRGDGGIRGKESLEWLREAKQRRAAVTISVQTVRN